MREGVLIVQRVLKHADVVIAAAVVAMVVMMVVPLPPALLDLLLSLNLTVALLVLLVAMYTQEPLEFSIFPSLLLVTTLFRLALNVSSTRLILLHGEAGRIIRSFGEFVVGGNPVVGFVVFLILAIIQFVVITRGAERVAEVAARFTLDAMPGKQMAIDADLNAGLITEDDARKRRREIEREADFYGAMDGAAKFVKGDAIAAVIITIINLLGGFAIGVWQRGLAVEQALQRYSLLTVGDGLVTQIPALLISTATGIVVTRAASEANLGQDLTGQLLSRPRALYIAAGLLGTLAIMPGLPWLPFVILAAASGGMGLVMTEVDRLARQEAAEQARSREDEALKQPDRVLGLLRVDPLEIELGYGLIPLADPATGDLGQRVGLIRRQLALELGFIVPPIRIMDNMQLEPHVYAIRIRGVEVGRGELYLERFLAMAPTEQEADLDGIQTREPAFGLPAIWVAADQKERAELLGYTVVDPASVLATHLTEICRRHAHELLSRQEVQTLLDRVKQDHPAVVEELVPNLLPLGEVQKVLQNLLREGISIRDLPAVLEVLADRARVTKDPDLLTEAARQALARYITRRYGLHEGRVPVITLDPALERAIADAVEHRDAGAVLALEPATARRALESLAAAVEGLVARGARPIVLCSPVIRLYFKRLTERALPRLVVLSYAELEPDVEIEAIGVVRA